MSRALPWLCLLGLLASDAKSWCQVKNGKCTGQRRSFNGSSLGFNREPHLDLWERVIDYPEVGKTNGVRLADWDLDGDLDIIVADKPKTWDIYSDQPWQLSVLEQLANGSFIAHRTAIVELDNFEVADWDSDGKMDVLVCHAQNEHVIVSRLDLSPFSSPEVILNTSHVLPPDSSRACGFKMHAVDFDDDGDLDLILGNDTWHLDPPRYFERISPGEVIERQSPNPIAAMITKNESVRLEKIVDFDGDGRLDVVLRVNKRCHYGCSFDILYLHQAADGTFVEPIENPFADITISESGSEQSIEIADWNLDGLPDLFLIKKGFLGGSRGRPLYFEQVVHQSVLSHSDFNPFRYIDLSHCEEPHVADVNGDGQADLVIAHNSCNGIWDQTSSSEGDPLKLRLYLYDTGLNMKEVTGAFQNVTETELGPFRIALVDWDQDGDSDLLVAAFDGRVHYHEMIGGKWQEETELAVSANVTFPVPPFPQYSRAAHLMVQPVPVDWDNDGDIDLALGPDGWYWERLADGTLLKYPLEQSPFRNLSHNRSAAWRFVDCDLDGDWDLVAAPVWYSTMWVCEHKGSSLECDRNFRCLGMNLTGFGTDKHGRVYSFDFADMDGDQRPELLAMQRRDNRIGLWSAGFCTPPDACHKKGICQPHSEACACIAGHELHDCSGCEPHFYSIFKAEIGHLHDCKACPGAGGEVCHSRGLCFDDSRAKALANSSTAAFMAIGNGSCSCSEAHFGGVDGTGRQNCLEGNCPAGTEENDGRCHPCRPGYMSTEGGTCRACAPGTFALRNGSQCESCPLGAVAGEAGSSACIACPAGKHERLRQFCSDCSPGTISAAGSQCESCPVGTVAEKSGSSACFACPAGKYERLRQFCSDCSPGTISAAGSQCESCPVGTVAEKAGSLACSACPAGKHEERRQFCSACAPGTMSAAGNSSCTTCKAGFHASRPGSSACEMCAAGTFSEDGSLKCASCSPGTVSEAASATCSPCKPGRIARNSLTCEACPVGTYAPERSTLCRACPHRHVSGAESSSCQLCESILFRVLPDDRRERCTVSPLDIAFALTAWIALTCFIISFLVGCYSKLAVEDLSVQGDKLAVTTSLPHCFLRWDWASPEIYFTCTGVPDLDGGNTWKGKAQSIDELSLQSEKSIERQLDTSMGYLHVKFPIAFIMMGLWSIPLVFWCALFLGASVACLSQLLWPLILVVCCLGLVVGALAFFAWRRRGRHTSLAKRRRQFLRDLSGGPQPCDRGPQRSITAGKLQDFLQFFQAFIKERSMYYVCGNLVKPLTEPFQVSFVELVGPVNIQWFISHSWQMPVRHFSDSIFKHAQSYQKSWRESAYWICTFSNSQWDVRAELGNGRWQESSFYLSLISPDCKGTAMIIDELVQPLQRIWCLFEVYQTICLSRNGRSQGLLLCTSTGVLQEGNAGTDVAVAVARKIAHLDTRVAEATNEADRMMIHALIEQMPGGFDAMNSFVRETISDALKSSHLQYEKAFADLVHDLNDRPVPTSAVPLPTLLTHASVMAGPERQKDNG